MHGLTPLSIAGATTSLIASPVLIYIVLRAQRQADFRIRPYVALLVFEGLFLVAYMTFLSFQPSRLEHEPTPMDGFLGATHGITALVVFVGFWALLPIGVRSYGRGQNVFAERPALAWSAIVLRAVALLSGEAIFVLHAVT